MIAFDHRKSTLARASQLGKCPDNLELRINTSKSSACAVYDFFLEKLNEAKSPLVSTRASEKCVFYVP